MRSMLHNHLTTRDLTVMKEDTLRWKEFKQLTLEQGVRRYRREAEERRRLAITAPWDKAVRALDDSAASPSRRPSTAAGGRSARSGMKSPGRASALPPVGGGSPLSPATRPTTRASGRPPSRQTVKSVIVSPIKRSGPVVPTLLHVRRNSPPRVARVSVCLFVCVSVCLCVCVSVTVCPSLVVVVVFLVCLVQGKQLTPDDALDVHLWDLTCDPAHVKLSIPAVRPSTSFSREPAARGAYSPMKYLRSTPGTSGAMRGVMPCGFVELHADFDFHKLVHHVTRPGKELSVDVAAADNEGVVNVVSETRDEEEL